MGVSSLVHVFNGVLVETLLLKYLPALILVITTVSLLWIRHAIPLCKVPRHFLLLCSKIPFLIAV